MSKNAPQQKPSFLPNLIFIAVLMFAFNMMFKGNQTTETRTVDQIMQALRDDDANVKDMTAAHTDLPALTKKLGDAKIPLDQKDAIELEGAILAQMPDFALVFFAMILAA